MPYGAELNAIADRLYGNDPYKKPSIYLNEYDRLFHGLRDLPIRLLELGVYRGMSMQMWKEYFPLAVVVGLDGAVKPEAFPTEERFHFIHGGQDDPKYLDQAIVAAGGPFDIIIDDCSHLGCHTARSFAYMFPGALNPGGIYVIEDTCTAFTSCGEYDAAPYAPPEIGLPGMPRVFPSHDHGMIGLIKQLIDHSQAPTAAGGYTRYPIERIIVLTNMAVVMKAA